jgi:uncharacterized repeat protein (TIGR01451 family)
MSIHKPAEFVGRKVRSLFMSMRLITMLGLALAFPYWQAPSSSLAKYAPDSLPAGQLPGVTIKHGPVVKPIELNLNLTHLPAIKASPGNKVFPHPLEPGPTGLKKMASPASAPATTSSGQSPSSNMPAPIVSFKGLDFNTWGAGWPPDTVGDVGPNHYIQAVNTSIGIFSKSGTLLSAFTFDTLWSTANSGTACDSNNQGDVTVVYDPLGDRWIIGDFAFTGDGSNPPYYECIAVSKTANPVTGGWWLFAVRTDDATHPWFADYPKMGIWPDGLYMTANMFLGTGTFQEVRVWAFNRADLESGSAPRNVIIDLNTNAYFSLLPSNLRGAAPPAGRENLLVSESENTYDFEVFKFHVDYFGMGSVFSGPTSVSQTHYTTASSTVPSPANNLDSLEERLMMQAQYRNINGVESLWVNHTVKTSSSGPNGIQWAQINVTGGTISTTPVQQQIYGNLGSDGVHRWMGSLAVDKAGDMALGYSASSASLNPDIRYNGRLASDPLNTLPQGETTLLAGITRASQSGLCGLVACTRWGDYSAMTVDTDGCTFWYTNEYYETNSLDWQTRIGSFRFPSCTPLGLKKSANLTVYDHVGQTITYTYSITNSSDVTLTSPISVTDDKLGVINPCGTDPLIPGSNTSCSTAYNVTQADLDAGSITNQASATTTYSNTQLTSAPVTVTVTATQNPALSLVMSVTPDSYDHPGQAITYTYTLTNAGNVTLPGPFSAADDVLGTLNPCGSGPLAPGAHTGCMVIHNITQADLDNGSITNSATASTAYKSATVTSTSANASVNAVQNLHLSLARHTNLDRYTFAGTTITYTLTATDDGNTTLHNVVISDTLVAPLACSPPQPAILSPGEQINCTGSYTVQQSDLDNGTIDDTAHASGSGPQSQPVSAQVGGSVTEGRYEILLPILINN